MLEEFFVFPATVRRLRSGTAGPYLDDFVGQLHELKYKPATIRRYLTNVEHFARWLHARRGRLDCVDSSTLNAFSEHLLRCQCIEPYRGKRYYHGRDVRCGVDLFVQFLHRRGMIPAEEAVAIPESVLAFEQWMRQHRGTAESTLIDYRRPIRALLADVRGDVSRLDAKCLREFVLRRSKAGFRERTRADVKALRMFIRFLASTGQCSPALEGAIPTVASWRLATLPRYLKAEDVERVISSCDPKTPIGLRDRAMLLLLARLGLRAGDVRTLDLADIDWGEGTLRVSGKSRRYTRLPLPQDAGDALLAYIENGRPKTPLSLVFLRHKTPCGPLSSTAPSTIVRLALKRSGVDSPSFGTHLLRHSAATQMLREGASMDQIKAVLRHASLETTALYAKVDTVALRTIAQPWPEGLSC
jgi:site-specific recombinase XerD